MIWRLFQRHHQDYVSVENDIPTPTPTPVYSNMTYSRQNIPFLPAHVSYLEDQPQDTSTDHLQDQIQEIQDHRIKRVKEGYLSLAQIELLQKPLVNVPDSELQFLVKWVGRDQKTWQPGQNLKNAPQILDSYKRYYFDQKNMSSLKPEPKKRGRKPKNPAATNPEKSRGARGRSFNFARVYKESDKLKVNEEDELFIIDKETYIKGTREPPVVFREEQKKKARDESVGQDIKELRREYNKEDKKDRSLLFQWEKQKDKQNERLKSKRQKVNEEMSLMGLFDIHNEQEDKPDERARNEEIANHKDNKVTNSYTQKYKPVNQEVNLEEDNEPLLDQQQPQANIRSFINTQEQRYNVQPEQYYPEQYDEMPADYCQQDEQLIRDNNQSEEDIFDMFVRERRHQDKPQQVNLAEMKEINQPAFVEVGMYLNEGSKSAQHAEEVKSQPSIKEKSYKRGVSHVAVQKEADILTKRIKPNEGDEQPQKKAVPTINLIDDDSPLESVRSKTSKKSLKQQIRKELQSLLNNGAEQSAQKQQELANAFQLLQPSQQANQSLNSKNYCISCERQEEEASQLRHLFNELLQQEQINLDALFLEQQTFAVLNSLNPNSPCNSATFLRNQKMTDISDNSTFRLLISRKIALIDSIPAVLSDYSLKKLIKMGDEWIAIFQINNSQAKLDHYKYVQATDLLSRWRNLVVDFLMK